MSNLACKHLFKLVLVVLITACTPEPIIYKDNHGIELNPPIPTVSKSIQQTGSYSAANLTGRYANSAVAHNFIRSMVVKHGFSQHYLNGLFSKAIHLESVVRLENPPKTKSGLSKPSIGGWSRYRKKFLTSMHINNGVKFWRENARSIQNASVTYKVDPEYIVAIIGVETFFGRNVGKTRTMDALTTLAFDTQRRRKFFTSELENFLLMTAEEGYEPRQIVGSWAGAMGLGQFMPSSFRRLAIDFNNDNKRDLWNKEDAIGSVAHYFSRNGWKYLKPVTMQTSLKFNPSATKFSTYSGDEYWHVYPNFKVIKRYNNSNYYAMAVYQLAQAIKAKLGQ